MEPPKRATDAGPLGKISRKNIGGARTYARTGRGCRKHGFPSRKSGPRLKGLPKLEDHRVPFYGRGCHRPHPLCPTRPA